MMHRKTFSIPELSPISHDETVENHCKTQNYNNVDESFEKLRNKISFDEILKEIAILS